jgi:hypothetical protein
MFWKILALVALVAVAVIMFAGIAVMAVGGDTGAKWSNRLMRYRILAQAVAVAIVLAAIYFSS